MQVRVDSLVLRESDCSTHCLLATGRYRMVARYLLGANLSKLHSCSIARDHDETLQRARGARAGVDVLGVGGPARRAAVPRCERSRYAACVATVPLLSADLPTRLAAAAEVQG